MELKKKKKKKRREVKGKSVSLWSWVVFGFRENGEEKEGRRDETGRGGSEHVHHLLQRRELSVAALLAGYEPPATLLPSRRASSPGSLFASSFSAFGFL